MVRRILRALLSHYTRQKEKLTLKRQDNSSSTMFLRNHLTTELQGTTIPTSLADTSEKIIMEKTIDPVVQIRDWSIDRIHYLADTGNMEQQLNAVAIAEEFNEWINLPEGKNELDYLCLEREDGFGDQEIDVR
jgi:hypothetical protein